MTETINSSERVYTSMTGYLSEGMYKKSVSRYRRGYKRDTRNSWEYYSLINFMQVNGNEGIHKTESCQTDFLGISVHYKAAKTELTSALTNNPLLKSRPP